MINAIMYVRLLRCIECNGEEMGKGVKRNFLFFYLIHTLWDCSFSRGFKTKNLFFSFLFFFCY